MVRTTLAAALVALPLAALAAPSATADLKNGAGQPIGSATFSPAAGGVQIRVQVKGLKPGQHGVHVHGVGACDGPDFKTAGGHFNPAGKKHGLDNPEGHHGGDLPNLVVAADGTGSLTGRLDGVALDAGPAGLLHEGGTSVVIHADADDEKSDPAGNSGARIACGVVKAGG